MDKNLEKSQQLKTYFWSISPNWDKRKIKQTKKQTREVLVST